MQNAIIIIINYVFLFTPFYFCVPRKYYYVPFGSAESKSLLIHTFLLDSTSLLQTYTNLYLGSAVQYK